MSTGSGARDLLVLVADKNMEYTLRGLLSRPHALGTRALHCDFLVHPERDPGCRLRAHELLRAFHGKYAHALVVFDRQGCGSEQASREELEQSVESDLRTTGWGTRATAIVLDPELEVWVWSDSPHVAAALGWSGGAPALRAWLEASGLLRPAQTKPDEPKEAVDRVLQYVPKPRSSAMYRQLAESVSFERCADRGFAKLRAALQSWFPG